MCVYIYIYITHTQFQIRPLILPLLSTTSLSLSLRLTVTEFSLFLSILQNEAHNQFHSAKPLTVFHQNTNTNTEKWAKHQNGFVVFSVSENPIHLLRQQLRNLPKRNEDGASSNPTEKKTITTTTSSPNPLKKLQDPRPPTANLPCLCQRRSWRRSSPTVPWIPTSTRSPSPQQPRRWRRLPWLPLRRPPPSSG